MPSIERLTVSAGAVTSVTAAIHRPVRAGRLDGLVGGQSDLKVLLTPGAGGTLATPGLVALADTLAALGVMAIRANLPYRETGRRTPPRAEAAVDHLVQMLASARQLAGPGLWLVGGKSYGSRVASLAVAEGLDVAGLLCYGYPLHPPGRRDRLRVDHWPHIVIPTLMVQGDRDPMCDLALLDAHKTTLPGPLTVHVVEGGDHSLRIARKASPTGSVVNEAEVMASLAAPIGAWLQTLLATK